MQIAESSWWHGRAEDESVRRARAVTGPAAERSVLQQLLPGLTGWIRVGAPLTALDPVSIARLLALTTLFTVPTMLVASGLVWQVAAVLTAGAFALLVVTYLRDGASTRGTTLVLVGCIAIVITAVGFAAEAGRTGVALAPMVVAALFMGLFFRLRPILLALSGSTLALLTVARLTGDRLGTANALTIIAACWLVATMSAAMASGARQAGSIDADTGVPNARGIQRMVARGGSPALIATVRLVGVGAARDALGHDAASELVRGVTRALGRCTTSSMRLARVADDELTLFVPIVMERDDAERLVLRTVTTAIGDGRYLIGEVEVSVEAHVGVAVWHPPPESGRTRRSATHRVRHVNTGTGPGAVAGATQDDTAGSGRADATRAPGAAELDGDAEHESVRDVFRRSSLAARQAADAGVPVRTWDGVATTLTADDLSLLADLRVAIEHGELWVAYQPQFERPDRAPTSVEALMRWRHPTRGEVSPERFVTLAERTGLIDRLTDWIFGEALDAQRRWRSDGLALDVSVNVSPISLRRTDFAGRVSEAIVARGLPPEILTVEVTESSVFDVPQAVERLRPLRALGVRISIDDFGTGYTSLAILPKLAIDEVKLDQCFVRDSVTSPASEAIVRSMCDLAHRLELRAVAEGAESLEIVHRLRVAGYDLIQGFALSRPLPEAEVIALTRDRLAAEQAERAGNADQAAPPVAAPPPTTIAERLGPLPTLSLVGPPGSITPPGAPTPGFGAPPSTSPCASPTSPAASAPLSPAVSPPHHRAVDDMAPLTPPPPPPPRIQPPIAPSRAAPDVGSEASLGGRTRRATATSESGTAT